MIEDTRTDRDTIMEAVGRLGRGEVAIIAAAVRETAPPSRDGASTIDKGDERLAHLLGPRPAQDRRLTNEMVTTMRGFERRRQLLQDSFTAAQVATALGVSRETVYARAERGQLLAATDGGQLRFPRWQFDPASDTGLLAGLSDVVKVLGERPQLGKIAWLTSRRSSLGDTPLNLIAAGQSAAVMGAAERFARGE